jgi:Zn-dependent protease with chaperone function
VPSGTTFRFGTLIALAIATTFYVFGFYASVWPSATTSETAGCQVQAGLYFTSEAAVDPDEAKWSAYRQCMSGLVPLRLGWVVGGLLALLLATLTIYYLRPAWRVRRSHLERLDSSPELWAKLGEPLAALVERAGLSTAPVFLLDPSSMRAGGVAFGRHGKPLVCLDAGLLVLFDRDRATFDAVVLHELAHVRNGDVGTAYGTLALWRSFLLVVLAPFVVVLVDPLLVSENPLRLPDFEVLKDAVTWGLIARLAVLVLLVYLARTAVLRSRERYADALVARWTGSTDPYAALAPVPRRRRITIHPTRAARVEAMRDPRSLLRPGFWEVLASGLAVQLAWSHLVAVLVMLRWYTPGNLVAQAIWSVPVGVVVCLVAWRGARYGRSGFVVPGLGLGIGLVLGVYLGLDFAARPLTGLGVRAVAAIAVIVAAVLVCCWAGYVARLLGEPRTVRGALTATAVVVVCLSFLSWSTEVFVVDALWRDDLGPALDLHEDGVVKVVVLPFILNTERILTAAAFALLWLVPLLLVRGRVWFGLVAGLVGGGLWALVAVWFDGPPLVVSAWELVAAVVVQLVLAALVTRRAGWVVALFAVWVTGVVAGLGIWSLHLDNGQVDSILAARPLQVLPFAGTAAALLGAAFVPRTANGPQPRPGRLALAGVVLVSAVAVVWWPSARGAAPLVAQPVPFVADEQAAVATWVHGGGWERFMAVMTANTAVFDAFATEDPVKIANACEQALGPVDAGLAFPKPPAEKVRAAWSAGLEAVGPGARECVRIFRDGGGDPDLMVNGFKTATAQLGRTLTLLSEARERGPK